VEFELLLVERQTPATIVPEWPVSKKQGVMWEAATTKTRRLPYT